MSNLSAMHAEITDDLNRDDLSSAVVTAIKRAVKHYNESKRYWFHEERVYTEVGSSTAYYSLPSDFDSLDLISITENSDTYVLSALSDRQIEDGWDEGNQHMPKHYAIYDNQIRLYPKPDRSLTMTLHYRKDLSEVTTSASNSLQFTNEFFTYGYDLVRFRAEFDLYANKIHDQPLASLCKQQEMECERALDNKSQRRKRTGKLQKWM